MNALHNKFLLQLKTDIARVAQESGEAGEKLIRLSEGLEIDEANSDLPVSFHAEVGKILIHVNHPAVAHLLGHTQRRHTDLVFFLSSMMSLLNREEEVITDDHEREFHARLIRFALEDCQGSWAGSV